MPPIKGGKGNVMGLDMKTFDILLVFNINKKKKICAILPFVLRPVLGADVIHKPIYYYHYFHSEKQMSFDYISVLHFHGGKPRELERHP